MYGAHSKFDNGTTSTEYRRSRKGYCLLQGGNTQRNVAVRLGVSQSVVGRLWQRFQATNSVRNRPRSGRPRSTTNREDRYITNMALRQRTTTARRLRDNLRTATGTRVSDQTIRNRLRANNLRCRRQAVRPPLLPHHGTAIRHWCTLHLRWQRVQWGRVMFTDESRFSIQFNDGRVRVYRRPGERFADINVRQRHRFGCGSIMVWGGISIHYRTPLYVVDSNLRGIRYLNEIIRPLVLPGLQQIGVGAVLQDDNARPHRARVVTDFLRQQGIARMDWLAYSPDLAPIEHAWDELGRRVRNNHAPPDNLHDMGQLLMAEWQAIPQEFFRRLINSMRQRCVECIRARGGFTRY